MFKRLKKGEAGQAMVEFALCLPIVLMILGAILDFGWVYMHELTLSTAVREGARAAVTGTADGSYGARAAARVEETASICSNGTLNVSVTSTNPASPGSGDIRVTASYRVRMLTPVSRLIFGGMTYEITGSCTMRAE